MRIITARDAKAITITVDGRLVGEYIEVLDTSVKHAMVLGKPVNVFLRDVPIIDESGRALLRHLAAKGVHLSAAGVYNSYIVAKISASGASGPSQ